MLTEKKTLGFRVKDPTCNDPYKYAVETDYFPEGFAWDERCESRPMSRDRAEKLLESVLENHPAAKIVRVTTRSA